MLREKLACLEGLPQCGAALLPASALASFAASATKSRSAIPLEVIAGRRGNGTPHGQASTSEASTCVSIRCSSLKKRSFSIG